ncbi:MAG: sugar transferase [Acidimicrobiales bacterium]
MIPLLVLVGLALRISLSKRRIFFRQDRVGLDGKTFSILKYRTMEHDRRVATLAFDGSERRICHKSDNDPRHTSVGRLLRKFSV